ncbi:hypothetical protein FOA43_004390 [Brettanomyces nanus]|uniref:Uncharacterized protein n=1 Tax=Eeniella nana TaxID=13502 RepID=A0A875S6N6_EENNA|nr:uncharacterized protein FOA43_004390 [Brettanomyces nanus]QPG76996.1 hypothetical protein FOA43_004390 [Brettanomyces nanus]
MTEGTDDLNDGLDYSFDASEDEGTSIIKIDEARGASKTGEGDDDKIETEEEGSGESQVINEKKRKSKEKDKLRLKKRQKLEYDAAQKKKLPTETADVIAERLATKVKSQNKDLSSLELGDIYVNKSFIEFTGDWDQPRNLINFPKFLKHYIKESVLLKALSEQKQRKKNKKHKKKNNEEETDERSFAVILSMSAIRACDVHRATRTMNVGSTKLISKNKLKDDITSMRTSSARIIATTPGRFTRILDTEQSPLKASQIKAVICDCYMDPKMQTLWDSKDTISLLRKMCDANEYLRILLY